MCQIHASINFTQRKKPYKPSNNPACQSVESGQNELDNQDESDEENNSREDTETNILDTMTWKKTAMLEEEEMECENDEYIMNSDFLSNYMHLAIDHKAKWELSSLFSPHFEKPSYMNSEGNLPEAFNLNHITSTDLTQNK
ncbi:17472_t:CDS:2 [Cetraspora pellucida]|uniref:17472_t:CDS:1 n=1 Tax=Cetraspora pellucida TaxID=1433469 RepID=A0ACA9JVL3_9GLOM|nr:17472_t:CDS:2 [Cetraspora pellucida]